MKNIVENNIRIALALGFQKTALGWYDANEVLAGVETDGNTFDELIFHENRDWQRAGLIHVLGYDAFKDCEKIDLFYEKNAYPLLMEVLEIDTYDHGEEKMAAVVVEELTKKHIDCVLRLCDDDADIIQHLGKARKMIDEVLRENLINAIRHMAKNGRKMEIRLESGEWGKIVAEEDYIYVSEDGYAVINLEECHTVELQNFYAEGKKHI